MNYQEFDKNQELFQPGDLLADGKYKILSLVGIGGMGQVYKAHHTVLGRVVAIKVLHPSLTVNPKVEARFQREARATSLLDHQNIIKIIDFGSEEREGGESLLYIVMEFIEGRELSDILKKRGPLPAERTAFLISQVCAALFQAHEAGVVHRDLKPENILILKQDDDDGYPTEWVKVCDFGLAKIQSSEEDEGAVKSKLTAAGEIFGTPHYMAPEQARGVKIDSRADIYSLGIILYYMSAGRLPFEGESLMDVITQQIINAPPLPSDTHQGVDPRIESIIMRCLEKDPADRYQSARDLRAELLPLVGQQANPLHSRPATAQPGIGVAETLLHVDTDSGRGAQPGGRKPVPWFIGLIVVAVLAALGIIALFSPGRVTEEVLETAPDGPGMMIPDPPRLEPAHQPTAEWTPSSDKQPEVGKETQTGSMNHKKPISDPPTKASQVGTPPPKTVDAGKRGSPKGELESALPETLPEPEEEPAEDTEPDPRTLVLFQTYFDG